MRPDQAGLVFYLHLPDSHIDSTIPGVPFVFGARNAKQTFLQTPLTLHQTPTAMEYYYCVRISSGALQHYFLILSALSVLGFFF